MPILVILGLWMFMANRMQKKYGWGYFWHGEREKTH